MQRVTYNLRHCPDGSLIGLVWTYGESEDETWAVIFQSLVEVSEARIEALEHCTSDAQVEVYIDGRLQTVDLQLSDEDT